MVTFLTQGILGQVHMMAIGAFPELLRSRELDKAALRDGWPGGHRTLIVSGTVIGVVRVAAVYAFCGFLGVRQLAFGTDPGVCGPGTLSGAAVELPILLFIRGIGGYWLEAPMCDPTVSFKHRRSVSCSASAAHVGGCCR